jgi:LysR family transcriptional regulator, transcriptional activator of nhaA
MLNYNHLHYFHMAASEGSVAAAADRLGVTQPTVSEQIRALEKALAVTLFERTTTGLKLTDAGRVAFEHTSVMFRAGERLVESLAPSEKVMPRTLRVGLTGSVARSTTSDFLMPLLAINDCVPTIRVGDAAELIRELRGSELDLVLSESEPPEASRRGLDVTMVATTSLVAIAPPSVVPDADWQNVGLIHYRSSSSFRWDVDAFLQTRGYRPRLAGEVDDAVFLLEAAARGGYVAFVPRSIARDAVAAKRVRIIAGLDSSYSGVYATYQHGTTADLAQRAVELLIEHARTYAQD